MIAFALGRVLPGIGGILVSGDSRGVFEERYLVLGLDFELGTSEVTVLIRLRGELEGGLKCRLWLV